MERAGEVWLFLRDCEPRLGRRRLPRRGLSVMSAVWSALLVGGSGRSAFRLAAAGLGKGGNAEQREGRPPGRLRLRAEIRAVAAAD